MHPCEKPLISSFGEYIELDWQRKPVWFCAFLIMFRILIFNICFLKLLLDLVGCFFFPYGVPEDSLGVYVVQLKIWCMTSL